MESSLDLKNMRLLKGMSKIKNDFDLIVHKLDGKLEHINIYPLGDVHVGSKHFNEKLFFKWRDIVEKDPNGYVVLVGDLLDMALKTSKTNSYEANMSPFEQKQWLTRELRPIRDRIIGVCQGNHEYRANIATGMCPLYDVLAKLDLEHLYRENMAFMKVNLGRKSHDRQWSYTLVLAHGGSKTKTQKFSYAIDGMDVLVTGHIHQPESTFPSKIVIDSKNEVVSMKGFVHIVVPSFQDLGGYTLKGLFMPQDNTKIPVIRLSGTSKEVSVAWI